MVAVLAVDVHHSVLVIVLTLGQATTKDSLLQHQSVQAQAFKERLSVCFYCKIMNKFRYTYILYIYIYYIYTYVYIYFIYIYIIYIIYIYIYIYVYINIYIYIYIYSNIDVS